MIASIDNKTKNVKLVSVYRDTFLSVGGGTYFKCNNAYARGGAKQAVQMLNSNLDLDIKEYVCVDWETVVEVIDDLGGRIKVTNLLDPRRQEIVMKPDDIVNLSNGRLFVETIRDPEALCWTEGLVRISGLPFDELMAKFEQVFDVKIVIARNSIPDIGKISGQVGVNDGIRQ